jgi:glycosyltransferase involved in cell wall biosynthesis
LDCLINVAWGEGKDLPSIEATMSGIPTILNDTPGHRGWVHPGIKKLIPATKMPMSNGYVGRFTSVDEVKDAMMDVYRHYPSYYREALQLASYVEKRVTWSARVALLGKTIGLPL